ncbi:metallophosphoesterase [bacterium]|nr:metallophosphoesterase [bacterium]
MLVGIMSDSHDNLPLVGRAVEFFNSEGCDLVLHAGDIISPFSIAKLGELKCPFRAVYGNNDGEKVGLKLKAASVGGSIDNPPITVEADGLKIRMLHDCDNWQAEAAAGGADVVVFGHTHQVVVEQEGEAIGINPGETGAWLSGVSTVALLDTATRQVRIAELWRM